MIRGVDLLLVLLAAFVLGALPAWWFEPEAVSGWILGNLLLVVPLLILQWQRRPSPSHFYPLLRQPAGGWPQLILFIPFALLGLDLLDYTLTRLFPPSPELQSQIMALLQLGSPGRGAAVVLTVLVLGPLSEELLFRGFVYRYLCDTRGVTEAVLISSLLFALFHPGIYALQVLLFGFLLALLRWRTGSLLPPLLLHLLNNGWSLLETNLETGLLPTRGTPGWWLLTIPGTLIGGGLFYRLFIQEQVDE